MSASRVKDLAKWGLLALVGFILGDVAVSVYDGKLQFNLSSNTSTAEAGSHAWCPAEEKKEVYFVSCSGFF
jgi:hypothetical protein